MSTDVQEPTTTDAEAPQRNIAIKSIKLTNLLSFGPDTEPLELRPLNVLIGANGSGKSNLIEAFVLLRSIAQGKLHEYVQEEGGGEDLLWKGKGRKAATVKIIASNWLNNKKPQSLCYSLSFVSAMGGKVEVTEEKLEDENTTAEAKPRNYLTSNGARENSTLRIIAPERFKLMGSLLTGANLSLPALQFVERLFKSVRIYRDWNFGHDGAVRKTQQTPSEYNYLSEDASNLGIVLKNLISTNKHFSTRMSEYLVSIYASAYSVDVRITPQGVQLIMNEGEYFIPINRLSAGTLRWLALLAALLHPTPPPLICLEEPEIGFHPDIIPILAKLLREASERTELIVTTHSRDLVDAFTNTPDVVVVCEKEVGATKMRRLPNRDELTAWLDKFSLGEMWSMNLLGGNRY